MKIVWSVLRTVGLVVLALALVAGLFLGYTVTRSFPPTNGSLQVKGLNAPVEVLRDAHGVPRIYATTPHDLFMAQGYVHAQDRFYQMDFWRHETAGRLSELYGSSQVDTDKFLRTSGWVRTAEQEYALIDPETKALLEAYADGVNAYIAGRSAADLSLEYSILGLTGLAGYQPEPWTPVHTLAWAKAMSWNLGGNMEEELQRAALNQTLGPDKTRDYMPLYPSDHPLIVPTPAIGAAALDNLRAQVAAVNTLTGPHTSGIGSNDWVVAGSRTTTGKPLLANDTHLGIQMPSIWYQISLHCVTVSPACPYSVDGFSFAGAPGVVIGHNARIAWGVTNVKPDVQDLFIEKLNPANPNEYEVNGQWQPMQVLVETIKVKGGADVPLTVRLTRHGPLISSVFGAAGAVISDAVTINGTALNPSYALAFRWTALDPSYTFRSILKLDRAQNFTEFREALRDWSVPSQNVVYADVDGNIGYQLPGNIPIRKKGDGQLPVPGWTDDYAWTGYIPFEKLPYSYNPPQGYLASANNPAVGPDFPYLIAIRWDDPGGYRARRIVDLLTARPKISPEYFQQMQGDDLNIGAQEILPYLLKLKFDDPKLAQAAEQLRGWDFQMRMDSQPAAVYAGFYHALVTQVISPQLPERYRPDGGGEQWLLLRQILTQPDNAWWGSAGRDAALQKAFATGYAEVAARLGPDAARWRWGELHTAIFDNLTLGHSGVSVIDALFNRGPFPVAGMSSVVNATSPDFKDDDPFAVSSLPSQRQIVDLSNLDNTLMIHTTGESGHAFQAHYIDMADQWRNIQYNPAPFSEAAVRAVSVDRLTLTP